MFRACAHKALDSGGKFALLLLWPHIGLLFGKRLDSNLYVIGSEISGFTHPHVIGFAADSFSSTLESGFKNIRIRCRIRRMRVDGSHIWKEKVVD